MPEIPGINLGSPYTAGTGDTSGNVVRLSDYITTTTTNEAGSITPGAFRPEDHPDFKRALDPDDSYVFFDEDYVVCRHCGERLDSCQVTKKMRATIVGWDPGFVRVADDGSLDWEPDYFEHDGDYEEQETLCYSCDSCEAECDELDELVVAFPHNELEMEELTYRDRTAFCRSIAEKRLILFDSAEAEARREEEKLADAQRRAQQIRDQIARQQAELARLENAA